MPRAKRPKLDAGRIHFRIQKTYEGIGQVRVNSHTKDPDLYHRMCIALDELYTMHDKWGWLRQLKRGDVSAPEIYELYKMQALHKAKSPSDLKKLDPDAYDWLDREVTLSEKTKQTYREQFRLLLREFPNRVVTDLPLILQSYKKSCTGKNKEMTKARTFNLARSAVMSYLSKAFNDQDDTWLAVKRVSPFPKNWRQRTPTHVTTKELLELLTKLTPKYRDVVWAVYTCGFRPSEYIGDWSPNADGCSLTIHGTKTAGSVRVCPMPYPPMRHKIHLRSFEQIMQRATNGEVQPYDLRRSFSRLLVSDEIGIPLWRVRAYMGHGAGIGDDFAMTLHYQKGKVTSDDLRKDSEKIRAFLDRQIASYKPPRTKMFKSEKMNAALEAKRKVHNAK